MRPDGFWVLAAAPPGPTGGLWATEMVFDYDGDPFYVVVIHQWRDGLVATETSYYAAPFEAPAWRAKWVELAPSAASN